MTGSHETFSERLDRLFGKNPSADANDLSALESQARSLINEISQACAELQTSAYTAGPDAEKQKLIETLIQKISTRRGKLGAIKDKITEYMHAAESNAQKIERQYLNNPDSDLNLQRAAAGAWSEVNHLSKLLEEIEQALSMSGSAANTVAEIQKHGEMEDDFRFTATTREGGLPPRDPRDGHAETSTLQPLLGQATPGGLSGSLKKVPIAAQGTSKIQAGLYKGGVYIESASINTLEMNVSSQGASSSSTRNGKSGEPSSSQKGGDGSYMAGGDMGVFSPTQKNDFGIW